MTTYLADTNFYLRFLLQDIQAQADKAEEYMKKAEAQKLQIIFISAVILEMEFILRKFYKVTKSVVIKDLMTLVQTPFLTIEDRPIWIETLNKFSKVNIDLLDVFLFEKAKSEGREVLSFDQDFKKLSKII